MTLRFFAGAMGAVLGCAVASQALALQTANPSPGLYPGVEQGDWTFTSVITDKDTGDIQILVRRNKAAPDAFPRVEMRLEYKTAQGEDENAFLSATFLSETDCAKRRKRDLRSDFFHERNLRTHIVYVPGDNQWESLSPQDPEGAAMLSLACTAGPQSDPTPRPPAEPLLNDTPWTELSGDEDTGDRYYFRRNTGAALAGLPAGANLWQVRLEARKPDEDGFRSFVFLTEFNCTRKALAFRVIYNFTGSNMRKLVNGRTQIEDWQPIELKTRGEDMFTLACPGVTLDSK